jgi:hypothetical protein
MTGVDPRSRFSARKITPANNPEPFGRDVEKSPSHHQSQACDASTGAWCSAILTSLVRQYRCTSIDSITKGISAVFCTLNLGLRISVENLRKAPNAVPKRSRAAL